MRIVFSIAHITIGGAQRVCINLIKWLQKNTSSEILLLVGSKLVVDDLQYDVTGINHKYLPKGTINKIKYIRREVKKFHPDIYVTFGVPSCLFDIPATIGLMLRHIVCERNDPAHFAGKTSTKIVSRLLMRLANGYVFQTKGAQDYYGGNIARNSVVIPNPVFDVENLPTEPYNGESTKTIVSVGRLNPQKNYLMLINAFKIISEKHPEYRLIIYGEGPERAKEEALIRELNIEDRVLLPGTTKNVYDSIHKASIFVLSSDFEGMPNALMEAMVMGLPCISTDCPCGGPSDLIRNNEDGILIPVNDKNALVNALEYMIDNPEKAKQMGKNAMDIRKRLSVDSVCSMWYSYFNNRN